MDLPLFLQLDVAAISSKGWLWDCPQAFAEPPYPKVADADFLKKEGEARATANSNNEEVAFHEALLRLDAQASWDILDTLSDKFLQHPMGQLGLPPKGDFKGSDPS